MGWISATQIGLPGVSVTRPCARFALALLSFALLDELGQARVGLLGSSPAQAQTTTGAPGMPGGSGGPGGMGENGFDGNFSTPTGKDPGGGSTGNTGFGGGPGPTAITATTAV